jgi:3-deoxy-D-manno-octulosonic-acid transferase
MEKDKVYKFLNPVGIQEPFEMHPLSPRLDKLDGKNIVMHVGAGGEQGILIPLVKMLPERYPQVNWNIIYAGAHATKEGGISLTEEQIKNTDGLIRGVVW